MNADTITTDDDIKLKLPSDRKNFSIHFNNKLKSERLHFLSSNLQGRFEKSDRLEFIHVGTGEE